MLSIFGGKIINIQKAEIMKEGWLSKESRYRKIWRDRWCVLTSENLYTFSKEKQYVDPTETIPVSNFKTIKSGDNASSNIFKIETNNGGAFQFQAKSNEEKESWIGIIGKAILGGSKSALIEDDNQQN